MENLFNDALYQKRLMYKASKLEDEDTSVSGTKKGTTSGADNVGIVDNQQTNSGFAGNVSNTDVLTIGDKTVDVLGSVTDGGFSVVLENGFSEFTNDILDKMREVIWKFNITKPTTPTEPTEPTIPTEPTEPTIPTDPTTPPDPNPEWDENAVLGTELSSGNSWPIDVGSTPKILRVNNPFTGTQYEYQISSTTGEAITEGTITYLKNGRLLVKGDNLKIVAKAGQKDDIILLGNHNEVLTGDEDDIVRDGLVIDNNFDSYYLSKNESESQWIIPVSDTFNVYATYGNKINTGDGNDYITMFGENYSVNMGSGNNDRFYSFISEVEDQNISGVEKITTQYNIEDISKKDNLEGWVQQGINGDCRLLSIINSFCGNTNAGNIKDILGVDITTSGNNITVKFNKYDTSKFGSENSITFSKSEVDNFVGAFGDIDTILIDIALNKLIKVNNDYDDYAELFKNNDSEFDDETYETCVEDATYNTLARYLTGSEEITYLSSWDKWAVDYADGYLTKARFLEVWRKYKSGEISNLGIGIANDNFSLGVVGGHAYSLKNVDETHGYVELVNPWDDSDILRLTIDDLFSYTVDVVVYGKDLYGQNIIMPNGNGYSVELNSGTATVQTVQAIHMGSSSTKAEKNTDTVIPKNLFANSNDSHVDEIQKEIQAVEDNINKAKAIFTSKNKFGEMLK